jgi:hypothetical protein
MVGLLTAVPLHREMFFYIQANGPGWQTVEKDNINAPTITHRNFKQSC